MSKFDVFYYIYISFQKANTHCFSNFRYSVCAEQKQEMGMSLILQERAVCSSK